MAVSLKNYRVTLTVETNSNNKTLTSTKQKDKLDKSQLALSAQHT